MSKTCAKHYLKPLWSFDGKT